MAFHNTYYGFKWWVKYRGSGVKHEFGSVDHCDIAIALLRPSTCQLTSSVTRCDSAIAMYVVRICMFCLASVATISSRS
jgi:hypothetical protein